MLGQVGQIGGAIVGGVYGGPGGAMAGASAGGAIGGMADANMSKPQQSTGAIERRAMIQSPQAQIAESQQALATLPPEQQKEYGPILRRAQMMGQTA